MGQYLLIANQTLGGQALDEEIQRRIEAGAAEFFVVVPLTEPELETQAWAPRDPMFQLPDDPNDIADALAEARRRSETRLARILDRIRAAGADAEGEIGDSDPYTAAESALERRTFDEVIVSTLPAGISRWIKMDLPSRVERLADVPVTTIEATG